MRITALVENTASRQDIGSEHGLSLYIETGEHRILFDTGQTELFAENAERLGIDLSAVDIAVLSHGHYDHGGGLQRFLEINRRAPVYLSRYAFEQHYNGTEKYIGLNPALQENDRLIYTGEEYKIAEGLTLYACNTRQTVHRLDSAGLLLRQNGSFYPEDFRHEQYLLAEEDGRRVLISGCSHKGILNIAEWFSPDVLVGGFHLMKQPIGEALRDCARQLDAYPTAYYTCHCTGAEQFAFMQPLMHDLHYLSAGQTVII